MPGMEVVFRGGGALGLILAGDDAGAALVGLAPPSCRRAEPHRTLSKALKGGRALLVASVCGAGSTAPVDTRRRSYTDVVKLLKGAPRPLTVSFVDPRSPLQRGLSAGSGTQTPPSSRASSTGLTWTAGSVDSLGQLPRAQLDHDEPDDHEPSPQRSSASSPRDGSSGAGGGGRGSTSPRGDGSGIADIERQWKQRERMAHREGYLHQREDGFLSRWQRRWFVLDYGNLKVYKDYDTYQKERQEEVAVEAAAVAADSAANAAAAAAAREQPSPRPRRPPRSRSQRDIIVSSQDLVDDSGGADPDDSRELTEFDFELRLPLNKTLTLRASSLAEKQAWMHAMQQGTTIKAERLALGPLVALLGEHSDSPHALEHPHLRIDDVYTMGELLGAGQVGRVYRAAHRGTGEPVAIKVIDKAKFQARLSSLRRTATREIQVLTKFDMAHPHIVRMRAVVETTDWLYIVMELLEGGALQDNIEARAHYSEQDAAEVMRRLGSTLDFLHRQGLAHRDIKPENIICGATHTDIKLADFGFVTMHGDKGSATFRSTVGTPMFMAPEIVDMRAQPGGYTNAVDMWSAGVLLYYMLSGTLPFDQLMPREMAIRRENLGNTALAEPRWDHISSDAKDLVRQMLRYDASERLRAPSIVSHPWVQRLSHETPELAKIRKSNARRHPIVVTPEPEDVDLGRGVLQGLGIVPVDATSLCSKCALWIGGIPEHIAAGSVDVASGRICALFERFGGVISVTLRQKAGTKPS
jgi:serine/threonine protein kinase